MNNQFIIPFINFKKIYKKEKKDIEKTLKQVFDRGVYILGKNVESFEKEFSFYIGVKYGIGVACGTDALMLALKALNLNSDDEVIVPANSYPTAFAVSNAGVKIKLVDVDESYTVDVKMLEKAVNLKTKAIIPVHLYGRACNMDSILKIAKKYNLFVIEDVAQAHGAILGGKKLGSFGTFGCFSFYPTKNLACFGDGGMVVTNNKRLAKIVKELRMYGESKRYKSIRCGGINSRLDELHAAVLRIRLKKLDYNNKLRQKIAELYIDQLKNTNIILPEKITDGSHVYHLFVVRLKGRNRLRKFLGLKGVGTGVHFPYPINLLESFAHLDYKKGDFLKSEKFSKEILSLPIFPYLSFSEVRYICKLIKYYLQL